MIPFIENGISNISFTYTYILGKPKKMVRHKYQNSRYSYWVWQGSECGIGWYNL